MDLHSAAVKIRHCPAARSPRRKVPMRTRISRNVGWPMAAVMRRTWRFLPSTNSSPIQQSGTRFAKTDGRIARRDFWRSGVPAERRFFGETVSGAQPGRRCGGAGLLPVAAPEPTPGTAAFSGLEWRFRVPSFFNASGVGMRSTCAQYSRSWAWRGCNRRSFHSGSSLKSSRPSESASSRPIGINIFRKAKSRQRAIRRAVAGELRKTPNGLWKAMSMEDKTRLMELVWIRAAAVNQFFSYFGPGGVLLQPGDIGIVGRGKRVVQRKPSGTSGGMVRSSRQGCISA